MRRSTVKAETPDPQVGQEQSNNDAAPSPKKGKRSWAPAQKLEVRNKKANLRYRWVSKDPENVDRKLAEGYTFANKTTGAQAEHMKPGAVSDGQELTTATEYREMVLMAVPEETAQARQEYFQELTDKQTVGLKGALQRDVERSAHEHGAPTSPIHGKLTIE